MFPPVPSEIWLATSFPSSKGARYPFAVELARGADYYREDQVGKGLTHVAGFRDTRESLQRAIAVLDYAGSIRGCMTSNGSSIWDAGRALRVLRCYLGALSLENPFSYCCVPYESTFRVLQMGATPALLPCRLVDGYFIKNWHTTGTIPDQLQAAAVEAGCEWCPLFKPILYDAFPEPHNMTPCGPDEITMSPRLIPD
jgi:hypothetical protein